ncbi:hypothetical protein P885DRAFT_81703 [Corynascus similis CBS 632.67]
MKFQLPSWLSWYKKPEYRDIKEYAANVNSGKRALSPDGRDGGIPSRLRLERILANKTCSPMSLYDFYMYLKYIEYSAENLEFYIWFKNYEAACAKGLAVDSKDYGSIPAATQSTSSISPIKTTDSAISVEKPDGDVDVDEDDNNEAAKETLTRISELISTTALCASPSSCAANAARFSFLPPSAQVPETATPVNADPKIQLINPSPTKPSPTELSTIVSLFLLPGSPKELNIPQALRDQALAQLTTANSATMTSSDHHANAVAALRPVAEHAYSLLRHCSHRNFVRLGVGNGTFETICVATLLGGANLLAGFVLTLCLGLASPEGRGARSRWDAWAAWPLWWLGMSLVLSGMRGSCFFLLLFSRRQRLPWERFDDGEEGDGKELRRKGERGRSGRGLSENKVLGGGGGLSLWRRLRRLMIFDRRVKVQDRQLRRLQRKIVVQSLVGGAVFATLCVLVFLWLPIWKETV